MENFSNYKHSALTGKIIEAAYEVYNYFGYGFLESVYENSMAIVLREKGFKVEQQMPIKVYFRKILVGNFKADLIVNDKVIIELKAVSEIIKKHEVQLVNYLRATEIEIGLLVNFGEDIKVKRRVFSNDGKRAEGRI